MVKIIDLCRLICGRCGQHGYWRMQLEAILDANGSHWKPSQARSNRPGNYWAQLDASGCQPESHSKLLEASLVAASHWTRTCNQLHTTWDLLGAIVTANGSHRNTHHRTRTGPPHMHAVHPIHRPATHRDTRGRDGHTQNNHSIVDSHHKHCKPS